MVLVAISRVRRLDKLYDSISFVEASLIVDKYAIQEAPYGRYVISVRRTFPTTSCLKFLFNRFGTTVCSLVAFIILLYVFAFLIGHLMLYFLIILCIHFLL